MTSRLSVSLANVAANYRQLSEHNRGPVAAVVKADGYGLGATAIAQCLLRESCQTYFVATPEEGAALRKGLESAQSGAADPGRVKIYVLAGAYPEVVALLVNHNLTPVLNTAKQIQTWSTVGRPAGLHFDSGMQRLGLPLQIDLVADLPFNVELFVSHFARADEPSDPSIKLQIDRALACHQQLTQRYPEMVLSLSNSAAILEDLEVRNLGRAGIALYGGNAFEHRANPMLSVACLQARVLQVRRVAAGVPIGYGGTYVTAAETDIATLGAGYADGIPRLLSNQGEVWLAGRRCSMLGRVSMDLVTVDVSGLAVAEGDWAEIIGPNISVDEVAEQAQTISYEVLTGLGRRSERIYLDQSW